MINAGSVGICRTHNMDETTMTENTHNGESIFGPVIYSYSRAQAIEDGVLIDVSELAKEVGIIIPTALTVGAWEQFVKVREDAIGQDTKGRLWAVLNMFYAATRRYPNAEIIRFDVLVANDEKAPRPMTLKAIIGPGDTADSVVTIMLPRED
jgi:hypothetical protein